MGVSIKGDVLTVNVTRSDVRGGVTRVGDTIWSIISGMEYGAKGSGRGNSTVVDMKGTKPTSNASVNIFVSVVMSISSMRN